MFYSVNEKGYKILCNNRKPQIKNKDIKIVLTTVTNMKITQKTEMKQIGNRE